jgi:hypothetical protein
MDHVHLRVAGGFAALAISALFALYIVLIMVVPGQLGFDTPAEMYVPAKALPILQDHTFLPGLYLFGIPLAVCALLMALALDALLHGAAPIRAHIANVLGIMFATFVLAADISRFVAYRDLAKQYEDFPEMASAAFVAVGLISWGFGVGATMALGAWMILNCWAGLATRRLPGLLCVTGLGLGGLLTISYFLGPWNQLPLILNIFWFPFLGTFLLRTRGDGTTSK